MKDLLQVGACLKKSPKLTIHPLCDFPTCQFFSFLLFSESELFPNLRRFSPNNNSPMFEKLHLITELRIHHLFLLITIHDDFNNADPSSIHAGRLSHIYNSVLSNQK